MCDNVEYRPAESAEDSERDKDYDENDDDAHKKRRYKRRRSHEPSTSIKRRRYGHSPRQHSTNATRSVARDRTTAPRILSPSLSYTTSDDSGTGPDVAPFQEWQLENVTLKRVVLDSVATFQLQFDWDLCSKHDNSGDAVHERRRQTFAGSAGRINRGAGVKAKFTLEEDCFLVELKNGEGGRPC